MRLDDFDPNDINVGQQRGGGGFGGGGGGGMLLGLLPLIGSRFGCGGIVVVLLLLAVFGGLGNLGGLVGGGGSGTSVQAPASQPDAVRQACSTDAAHAACNAFQSAQTTWEQLFAKEGQRFAKPNLQFYSRSGTSGCGAAQSAMGPFYCPSDQGIYLDTTFFDELQNRFGAAGDFAQYYVIAHEFGHHIQNLLGESTRVQRAQQAAGSEAAANALSVGLELQADCYAGVWAGQNRDRLDPGDVQEGMTAAAAIGDDTLQQKSGGRVSPESFTHGTSAQRQAALQRGLTTRDPAACQSLAS